MSCVGTESDMVGLGWCQITQCLMWSLVVVEAHVGFNSRPCFTHALVGPEIAETRTRSGITLIKDEDNDKAPSVGDGATETGMCFWWRRGREPVSEC